MRGKAGVSASGLMRGTVTRVAGSGVFVKIAKLGPGERGPLPFLRSRVVVPLATTSAPSGGTVHTHTVAERTLWSEPPRAGDTVLVTAVDGSLDELVVIGVQS